MLWTRTLSRGLAASVAGLLSVSLVLALVGVKPRDNTPTPVVAPLSAPISEVVPIFTTTEPAKNESILVLQTYDRGVSPSAAGKKSSAGETDDREVHGWVAGKKSFAGKSVYINGRPVQVRDDNTFVLKSGFRGQFQVNARLDRNDGSPLTAHTTLLETVVHDGPTIFFVTDRSAYRPGHTLKFVAFLRALLANGEFEPIRDREITVDLTSVAKHTRAARLKLMADGRGRVTGEYTFSDADALDHYVLTAEGFSGSGRVMLGEYRKSKVALKLKGEVKNGKLSVAFDARDYLDRPVKGTAASYTATITRTVEPEKLTLNPEEFAKPESGPPVADEFDTLPDDERLFTLAHGVSAMTFAGFGSRLVSSREGTVPVQADGTAKLELDLHPEWLKDHHTITISGVFTDETGRENRSSGTFNLAPNPTRGMRISAPKELYTTGEKITATLSPFGLAANDKPTTTLIVVRLEAQPETPWVIPGSESSNNALLDLGRLPALSQERDKPKKTEAISDWKSVPVFDPIKRVIHEFVPVANDTARVTLRQPGAYKLLAITHLADGSTLQTETGVVVKSPTKLPSLVLQLDKHEIAAGSRLQGTVHTRFAGAILLLTLRDSTGIKMMRTLTAGANGIARIDEPLPANLRYGCAVCVQYPESRDIIHAEQRELFVIPTDRMIRVTTTVPAEVGPGADINLGVQIDRQEETDLIVSVFDESLLGVSGDLSKDIRNFYLGDTRGQSRAARDLATTRFGDVTIESLIAKGARLITDRNALMREPALEYHLRGLLDRWRTPTHNLILADVVTLVRLAGLEVFVAVPFFPTLNVPISVPQNTTLADVLRWEKKNINGPNQKVFVSATVIGNVALISAVDWVTDGKNAAFTHVPDPWAIYRLNASGYMHPGMGVGFGQFGQPGGMSMTGFSFNPPNGFGSMIGFPYGQYGYYNQFGLGGMIGMGGMGSGMMGMRGGMGGINGGMAGIPAAQGIPNYAGAFAPGGQMGMSYGFNRDFSPQIGAGVPVPLPALALEDDVIRRDFADSAFWSASVRTDKTGKATATFKLPDSLTNWRVAVTAVSSQMHVGTGMARFKSTRSVMIWPMLPRTFTEGDVVRVFGTVHNLTDKEQAIDVHLKAENGLVMGGTEQSVKVPAKGSAPVYWTYKAGMKGWTDLLMSAKCEAGSDASLKHLPIVAGGILERETASGLVGKDDLKIVLPADFDPSRASVTVTVAPTLAADLADTLPYLVDYPYGCVEQTMSRFLPAIRVAQILRQSGISTIKDLELKLPKVVEVGQKRLIELQLPDGGWPWQGSGTTHEMMTPYALFGLIQAEEAGYPCPNPTAISRGLDRLLMYLDQMAANAWDHGIDTRRLHRGEINDSLYCLWVYTMKGEKLDLTRWWNRIETNIGEDFISDYGHALALELAVRKGKKELADKLVAELHTRAKRSGDRIYWTTAGFSRWGDNITEITAAVMKALVAHDPNDSLIPGVLAYFHGTKRGDHWNSTKDTACVLYALCDYLAAVRAGPAAAGLVKISVNGIDDGNVRLDSLTSKMAKLSGKTLKPGENLFAIKGQEASGGAMVRVVVEFNRGRVAEIPARDHGVKVVRTVSLRGADGTWSELQSGATVPAGSYLKIRVTATPDASTHLQYTLLESPKPAGGETVPVSDIRFPTPADAKSHVLREDREAMTCFHYEQAAGMVAAEYVVLTEFAGEFRIAPARVELMYKPTVGGHSASFVVNVTPKKP